MKSPREILLARHQAADTKLDEIRRTVVADLSPRPVRQPEIPFALKLWREVILPCRRIWAGFGVVWLVILAVNFSMRDTAPSLAVKSSHPSFEMVITFLEREGLLDVIKPREIRVAQPPKPGSPPRSERRGGMLAA